MDITWTILLKRSTFASGYLFYLVLHLYIYNIYMFIFLQMSVIKRNIRLFPNRSDINLRALKKVQMSIFRRYMERYNIKPLDPKDKLVRNSGIQVRINNITMRSSVQCNIITYNLILTNTIKINLPFFSFVCSQRSNSGVYNLGQFELQLRKNIPSKTKKNNPEGKRCKKNNMCTKIHSENKLSH